MKFSNRFIFVLTTVFVLVLGVKFFFNQPNDDSKNEMLEYINSKYDGNFKIINYEPAKRGFNDSHNQSVLTVESEEGILANVKEVVAYPGDYFDDYINNYASKKFEEKIDYSSIKNLEFAKTYITLRPYDLELNDLNREDFTFTNDIVIDLSCIIAISTKSDDAIMKELYSVYEDMQRLGYQYNFFYVAFSGDFNKSKNYTENFLLYGIDDWEYFDRSVKEVLMIKENGLSFEEFKSRLKKV